MKNTVIIISCLLLFGTIASAQDVITLRNGDEIQALVTEISTQNIKYKKYSNPDGPTYTIPVSEAFMIRFENGDKEVFSEQSTAPSVALETGLKYKDLKDMYNSKEYVRDYRDPHSLFWCGFGSFLFPGLGQICCGEWGRGLLFFVGDVALATAATATGNPVIYIGQLAVGIWSICDAVKVAKVINMYNQDLKGYSKLSFDLYPNLACVPAENGLQPTAGLTLAISF